MLDICGIKCVRHLDKYSSNNLFEIKFDNYNQENLQKIKQKINSLEQPLDKYSFYIYKNYITTYNLDCVHVINQWEKVTNKSIEKLVEQQ